MLNIRKEDMAGMAVIAVYGLVLGTLPHALASNVVPEPKVVEVVVVDPLEEFRNAKSLDGAELKSLLKAVGFEGKSLRVAWAVMESRFCLTAAANWSTSNWPVFTTGIADLFIWMPAPVLPPSQRW